MKKIEKIVIKKEDINLKKLTSIELQVYLRERSRGAGPHKKKKGKSSYSRKGRRKEDYNDFICYFKR